MDLVLWPSVAQEWRDLVDVVRHVDDANWHGVVVEDHFMADGGAFGAAEDPRLEVTSVLAALAAATASVRLAPLVLSATFRHPAVVANWIVTLDHVSGGRMTLGLGTGWQTNEHAQYAIELGSPGQRVSRLDAYCSVVRSLLDESVTNHRSEWFELRDAWCEPKPVQEHLPLLVGGKGDRMLELVARRADQWNLWAMPDVFAERSERLDRACVAIDRDPASIRRSTQALVLLTEDDDRADAFLRAVAPRAAFAGTPEDFAMLVAEWATVGVDEVIVPDWSLGTGARRADGLDAIAAAVEALGPISR